MSTVAEHAYHASTVTFEGIDEAETQSDRPTERQSNGIRRTDSETDRQADRQTGR